MGDAMTYDYDNTRALTRLLGVVVLQATYEVANGYGSRCPVKQTRAAQAASFLVECDSFGWGRMAVDRLMDPRDTHCRKRAIAAWRYYRRGGNND